MVLQVCVEVNPSLNRDLPWLLSYTLGTGKSFYARRIFENDFYGKISANKWWDKYIGQKNVLIEDFDQSHSYQAYYLKIWADRYAFAVEIKNGADYIRPAVIIVTSNYSIRDIFTKREDYEPLERRFRQIHKTTPWDATVNDLTIQEEILNNQAPKKLKSCKPALKKRKFDQPAVAKKPWTSKNGKIVPNTSTQLTVDNLAKTQEITPIGLPTAEDLAEMRAKETAKEKEVIELISVEEDDTNEDCDDMEILEQLGCENCDNCGQNIAVCDCYEEDDAFQDSDYLDTNNYSYDSDSEDLFDI